MARQDYSLTAAEIFGWSSITGHLPAERVSHLAKHVVGRKVLDAGCGGGAYVHLLSGEGFDVTGLDKYDDFLRVARDKGLMGTYVQGDVTAIPFPDDTFDCTFCFDVLEHVDDKRAIRELARVTSQRIIVVVPREDRSLQQFSLALIHYTDHTHLRYYTEGSLRELLQEIDYSTLSIYPELIVPAKQVVQHMVGFQSDNAPLHVIRRKACNFLLRQLLERASYREVFTGLVAIVNLA